ncbi:MAG TPA: hypothetical protein VF299_03255 [Mycobacterium sp.]
MSLIAAVVLAVVLGVAAAMTAMAPSGVRADHAAVVGADHAAAVAATDQERYMKSLDALAARTAFVSHHYPSGWRIADDNRLFAPPTRIRTAVGLGVGALVLALGALAGAVATRHRDGG